MLVVVGEVEVTKFDGAVVEVVDELMLWVVSRLVLDWLVVSEKMSFVLL